MVNLQRYQQQLVQRRQQIEQTEKKVAGVKQTFSQRELRGSKPIQRQRAVQKLRIKKEEILGKLQQERKVQRKAEEDVASFLKTPSGRLQWARENLSPEQIRKGKDVYSGFSQRVGDKLSFRQVQTGDEVETPYGKIVVPIDQKKLSKQYKLAGQSLQAEAFKLREEKLTELQADLPEGEKLAYVSSDTRRLKDESKKYDIKTLASGNQLGIEIGGGSGIGNLSPPTTLSIEDYNKLKIDEFKSKLSPGEVLLGNTVTGKNLEIKSELLGKTVPMDEYADLYNPAIEAKRERKYSETFPPQTPPPQTKRDFRGSGWQGFKEWAAYNPPEDIKFKDSTVGKFASKFKRIADPTQTLLPTTSAEWLPAAKVLLYTKKPRMDEATTSKKSLFSSAEHLLTPVFVGTGMLIEKDAKEIGLATAKWLDYAEQKGVKIYSPSLSIFPRTKTIYYKPGDYGSVDIIPQLDISKGTTITEPRTSEVFTITSQIKTPPPTPPKTTPVIISQELQDQSDKLKTVPFITLPTPVRAGQIAEKTSKLGMSLGVYSIPYFGPLYAASTLPQKIGVLKSEFTPIKMPDNKSLRGFSDEFKTQYTKDIEEYNEQGISDLKRRKIMTGIGIGLTTLYLGGVTYRALNKPIQLGVTIKYKSASQLGLKKGMVQAGRPPAGSSRLYFQSATYRGGQRLHAIQSAPKITQKSTTLWRQITGKSPKEIVLQKGSVHDFFGKYKTKDAGKFTGRYLVQKRGGPQAVTSNFYRVAGKTPAGKKIEPYILKHLTKTGYKTTDPTRFTAEKYMKIRGEKASWQALDRVKLRGESYTVSFGPKGHGLTVTSKLKGNEIFISQPSKKLTIDLYGKQNPLIQTRWGTGKIQGVYGAGKIKPLVLTKKIKMPGFKLTATLTKKAPGFSRSVVGLKTVSAKSYVLGTARRTGNVAVGRGLIYNVKPGKVITLGRMPVVSKPLPTIPKQPSSYLGRFLRNKRGQQLLIPGTTPPAPLAPRLNKFTSTSVLIPDTKGVLVTEPILGIIPVTVQTAPVITTESGSLLIAGMASSLISAEKSKTIFKSPLVAKLQTPILKVAVDTATETDVVTSSASASASASISALIPKLVVDIPTPTQVAIVTPATPVPVPGKTTTRIYPLKKSRIAVKTRRRVKPSLFIPFVRRKGRFRAVGSPVSKERAIKIGVRKVRKTLAASLQIRKPSGEIVQFAKPTKEFRVKGLTLIQRASKRLASKGEVWEIVKSQKIGKVKFI